MYLITLNKLRGIMLIYNNRLHIHAVKLYSIQSYKN